MTIQLGDTGKIAHGTLKTFSFSTPQFRETFLGDAGAITLPTVEGATNQVSFTVQLSDLPTISPTPFSMKYTASIICAGKVGASATTLNYRVFKNGTSIVQSSNASLTATQYWTQSHHRWFDVLVGDVLDVRLWSNQLDTTLDYYALVIYPTQFSFTKQNVIVKDLTYNTTVSATPSITQGRSAGVGNNGGLYIHPTTSPALVVAVTTGNVVFPTYVQNAGTSTYFGKVSWGDFNNNVSNIYTSATVHPDYQRNVLPSTISFREVLR